MDTTPLRVFASKARTNNRLLYGDLRRLRRDVLPTGARSREEIEVLLSLDRIERVDRDLPRYLAMTVSKFVLSTADPPGVIDGDTAAWLVTALSEANSTTASAVVRTLASQAHHVDEAALSALVRKWAKRSAVAVAQEGRARGLLRPSEVPSPLPLSIPRVSPDLNAREAAHTQIEP
jgi:hypothetical protein